jgi:hypothetical protein
MTATNDIFKSRFPRPGVLAGALRCRLVANLGGVVARTAPDVYGGDAGLSLRGDPTDPKDFEPWVRPRVGDGHSSRCELLELRRRARARPLGGP